jgi:hypothetical protein
LVPGRSDAPCRFARFRVDLKWIVVNVLANEKLASWFGGICGLVNVGGHIKLFFSQFRKRDWRQSTESDLRDVLRSSDTTLLQEDCRLFYGKPVFASNWADSICKFGILHDLAKLPCVHRC